MVSDFSQHGSGRQDPDSVPNLGIDQHETVADDQGISLEELSRAYAELVGSASIRTNRRRHRGTTWRHWSRWLVSQSLPRNVN